MTDIRSQEPGKYNAALAKALKESGDFVEPTWVKFVKTGVHKMRPTAEVDFWHKRTASILRQAYIRGIIGVNRLRTRFGGRKDRGMAPPEFRKAGGKIIRVILQQSEAAGLLEKSKSKRAGRQLTPQGKKFLEEIKA